MVQSTEKHDKINKSTTDDGGRWTPLGTDGPAKRRRLDLDSPEGSGSPADIAEESEAAPISKPSVLVTETVDDDDDGAAAEADTEDADDATCEPEPAQAAPAAPKSTGCK